MNSHDVAELLNYLALQGWDRLEATETLWDKFGAIEASDLEEAIAS